jgi:succinoglycan biosynthesis transport protein ExoP
MQLSTVYSKDHPDVQKVRREMEALSTQTGLPAFDRETLQSELVARQDELSQARDRYSPDHPDVKRLERTVEGLQSQLRSTPQRGSRASIATPDNPAYIQKQVQLRATSSDLEAALQRRDQLRTRLNQLEGHLTATPEVQREYSNLTRGYEQLLAQYNDVEQKLRQAETALNLESENNGERFTLLEPPGVPSRPASPNRLAVLLLTLVIAGALGAAAVAIAERSDGTVRSVKDVGAYLEIPPLVAIPYVNNHGDLRRRTRTRLIAATAVSVWVGLIVFLIATPP